ncbi:MAG: hypothetical protein ABSH47_12805 [Bryobacteraceae bacterium]
MEEVQKIVGDQLTDFIRSRNEQAGTPEIDWQAKKNEWVRSVGELYAVVQAMLRDSVKSRDVTIRTINVELTERFIGTYTIPVLELSVGGERVEFRPKGITIIGATGRVDVRGERDTVTLVNNAPNQKDGEWVVVLQRVPHLKMAQFDRESLKYVLERVMLPV